MNYNIEKATQLPRKPSPATPSHTRITSSVFLALLWTISLAQTSVTLAISLRFLLYLAGKSSRWPTWRGTSVNWPPYARWDKVFSSKPPMMARPGMLVYVCAFFLEQNNFFCPDWGGVYILVTLAGLVLIDPSHHTETLGALPSLAELEIALCDNVLHINSWGNHCPREKSLFYRSIVRKAVTVLS